MYITEITLIMAYSYVKMKFSDAMTDVLNTLR